MSLATVDQCQVVIIFLNRSLETVQHVGEIIVGQSALRLIDEQYTDVIRTICLQGLCR